MSGRSWSRYHTSRYNRRLRTADALLQGRLPAQPEPAEPAATAYFQGAVAGSDGLLYRAGGGYRREGRLVIDLQSKVSQLKVKIPAFEGRDCLEIFMTKNNNDLSKFLSYVLRHQPEAIGLYLDNNGWANIDSLIRCAFKAGYIMDADLLHNIVANSDKKRFTISDDGLHIRAAQGHATSKVNIHYKERMPPDILYHGTATRFLSSIQEQGLLPGKRHYVHLSSDEKTAIHVGSRYGVPVLLKIKSLQMHEHGFMFYQSDNGVWLTTHVPYQFIQQ